MWLVLVSFASLIIVGGEPDGTSTQRSNAPEPTAVPTATPVPTKTPDELEAEARYLDPRRLAAGPESYVGQNIFLQGSANNVGQEDDYTWVQLLAEVRDRSITESIVVILVPPDPEVLREECYRFFGIVAGTTSTTVVLTGAEREEARVDAYAAEPSERDEFSGCEAP
jgi:hypothetical protein